MAENTPDPALKAAAEALAVIVQTLSDYSAAAGSDNMRAAQRALGYVSMAYRTLDQAGRSEVPAYYPDYW